MTRTATTATRRPGFTLVELLVAITVVVALASIALVVVPDAVTRDRTTDGAGTVRQTLMIAKARAMRDGVPRGVRLVVGADGSNVAKLNAGATGQLWVTEMQFIEQPTPLVPKPDERIEVEFGLDNAGALASPPAPPPQTAGVFYMNMSADIAAYLTAEFAAAPPRPVQLRMYRGDELLTLTVTGAALVPAGDPRQGAANFRLTVDWANSSLDALVRAAGSGTLIGVSGFWINRPAQVLLGEPAVPLPKNVCIDLASSQPDWSPANGDYDILFTPSGEVLPFGAGAAAGGQINLWVRDYTKAGGRPAFYDGSTALKSPAADFDKGGEQQVVSIKTKTGSLGVFPIAFPPADPFQFATQGASSP